MRVPVRTFFTGVIVVLPGACALRPAPVSAVGAADPAFALEIERGRNIVRPLVRRGSGVAVAVGMDGRLVWSEGFGRGAGGGGSAVTPATPFRIYSLMKQITAVAALDAAQRGEVNLRDPVRRVLPELPEHYAGVTQLLLLSHRAGVRHYRDSSEARMTQHCAAAADALPLFVNDPLVSAPGDRESYSTFGFVLASAVLERAAGVRFDSLMQARIFEPAGMTGVRPDRGQRTDGLVYYDVGQDGVTRKTPPLDNSCKMGGGGFVASAEDVVKFHNAVLRGDIVPLAATRQLLGGRTSLSAGGSGPGGEALAFVDLPSRVSIVVLSNTSGLEQRMALERARDLLIAVFRRDEVAADR